MTLIVENINDKSAIDAFKALSKALNAKCKITKNSKAQEWKKESEELTKLYKKGLISSYDDADKMIEDILS